MLLKAVCGKKFECGVSGNWKDFWFPLMILRAGKSITSPYIKKQ